MKSIVEENAADEASSELTSPPSSGKPIKVLICRFTSSDKIFFWQIFIQDFKMAS
jgi:hypothetical protein